MADEKRELNAKKIAPENGKRPAARPFRIEDAERMLMNSARSGSRAAVEFISEVFASDMREIAGNGACGAEEVSGLFFLVAPERAIAAHLREIRGEGDGMNASEAQVLEAISDLRRSKVQEMRDELKEIAERSPYESVKEAAAGKLAGNK